MRKKQMGMVALVPVLPVQVKGTNNAQNQLVADSVKFKGSDLKTAHDIQAGVCRFGELGDYNILGEVTVLFANGKVALEPSYKPQLVDRLEPETQHRTRRQRNRFPGAERYSTHQHARSRSHAHQQANCARYHIRGTS